MHDPAPEIPRDPLATLFDEIKHLGERIDDLLYRMTELASEDPAHQRLQTIPGVGPVLAPIVLAKLGHAQQFKSGRDCAAWVGLVPKQMSTGGKTSLGGISKNGDRMLRTLLIHGARAVIRWASKHDHAQSRWIKQLATRVGTNKAVVALANKTMRMIWAVLTQGTHLRHAQSLSAASATLSNYGKQSTNTPTQPSLINRVRPT